MCHLGSLGARLDQRGEDGSHLRAHLVGVARHASEGGKARHELIDSDPQRGSITRDAWQSLGKLLEGGDTIFGSGLYLVLQCCSFAPLQAVVFDEGGGDGDRLPEVGNAPDGRLRRLLEEGNPVVFGHTIGDDLIEPRCQLLLGKGDGVGELFHLPREQREPLFALSSHGVDSSHPLVEGVEVVGNA